LNIPPENRHEILAALDKYEQAAERDFQEQLPEILGCEKPKKGKSRRK